MPGGCDTNADELVTCVFLFWSLHLRFDFWLAGGEQLPSYLKKKTFSSASRGAASSALTTRESGIREMGFPEV